MLSLKNIKPLYAIIFHILIGLLAYVDRSLMVFYMLGILGYFIYSIILKNNKALYVLLAAAYITGVEVFLRMTKAFVFYETGKYAVMFFVLLGILYLGFKRNAISYIVYILSLIHI